ncbi:MAG: transketolase C-terminal domain-containing protein [Chloroflexota bacterium]|nr:transketolase C-terminal domain-containing protein [Chloroflexota bacterium]
MSSKSPVTVLDSLNLGLHQAMEDDPRVILLGEDILDPYGGSFKVTRGLSSQFPKRVLTTPISEAGITGIAGGMALRGMHPVVEIMFGDFSTLITDQVINHLSKFQAMYHDQVTVPVVIRTPMGGRRGYGPTHSQTLEKLFLGVPGLTVLAPFNIKSNEALGIPGKLLYDAITVLDFPVFFVENKRQYLLKLLSSTDLQEYEVSEIETAGKASLPFYKLALRAAPKAQITLAAYGYMAHLTLEAAIRLAYDEEIFCEVLVPTQLSPFELAPLFDSVKRTSRLLSIEEGTLSLGWGAEVLARTAEALGPNLKVARRLTATGTVVPAAPTQEADCLPGVEDIIVRIREMV